VVVLEEAEAVPDKILKIKRSHEKSKEEKK
jgi:hypothetical protein